MSLFSKKQEVSIEGMKCEHCEEHIQEAIKKIPGVKKVKADRSKNLAIVYSENYILEEELKKAVESCNKTFVGVKNL